MLPRTVSRSLRSAVLIARPALARPVARTAAFSQVARRELPSTSCLTTVNLAQRYYSAAAKLKEDEGEDFFAYATPTPSSQSQESASSAAQAEAASLNDAETDGFFTPELTAEVEPELVAPSAADLKSSPDSPAGTSGSETGIKPALMPFHDLKGRMDHDTLKALTFKPFNLLAMSEVQKRVLGRMPELSGGATKESLIALETAEDTEARLQREKAGREDLLVKAKTGTGKTIAFLVPAIEARINKLDELVHKPDENGEVPPSAILGNLRRTLTRSHLGALVISPTRELATQIANEALKLMTWHKEMQVQLFVGGGNRSEQLKNFKSIRKGRKDIVVATPGRLRDLLSEPAVRDALATTDMLILDEADTLLDMGFRPDLDFIIDHLPKERQTFLFSATVSKEIREISREFLKPNHSLIDCVPKNESNVHLHVPQYVSQLDSAEEQLPHILRLIAHDQLINEDSKVIIFLPTTKQTMLFATLLRETASSLPERLAVHEIHSRLSQDQRSRANERFRRDKRASILVTSDVSARGVDYPGVTRVIQVGVPSSVDQYVHRVGRTGRGGSTGGRGDLVLLPFEHDFVSSLKKLPIKPFSAEELKSEIAKVAPAEAEKLQAIESKVEQLLPMLDPTAVNDVFMSLVGYYLGKADVVGTSKREILEGLKKWSIEGGGLAEAPYLSPGFLQKLGVDDRRDSMRGRGGARGGRGGSRFGMTRSDGGERSIGGERSSGGFGGQRDSGPRLCYNCNQPGHQAFECSEPRRERSSGPRDGNRSFRGGDRDSARPSRSGFDSKFASRQAAPRRSWDSRGSRRD